MAWSEWQPGEMLHVTPERLLLQWFPDTTTTIYSTDNGDVVMQGPHTAPSPWPTSEESSASSRYAANSAQTQPHLSGYTYWLPDQWDLRRDGHPKALAALTEGVDYTVIPGKDPWADDAYVEYESGPNVLGGWDLGTFTVLGHDLVHDVTAGYPTTGQAAAWLGGGPMGRQVFTSLGAAPVPGTQWAQWDIGTETDGLQFHPPDPGTVEQFYYWVDVATTGPPNTSSGAYFITEPVEAQVWPPRWRYWIPDGAIPLRQRQRDDGLGLSTARWRRGRSRQVSNRWKGYL